MLLPKSGNETVVIEKMVMDRAGGIIGTRYKGLNINGITTRILQKVFTITEVYYFNPKGSRAFQVKGSYYTPFLLHINIILV